MTPERWQRVKEVCRAAMSEATTRRTAFLKEICGDDLELQAEARGLLAAHDQAGTFLEESPVAGFAASVLEPTEEDWVGRRIGPYRLLAEIGRGGMGAVYRAVRDDDQYHTEVALKIVSDPSSRFARDRFFHERQILAGLTHPHIARLLDGGSTSDGHPYFVMDLVDGELIDVYCRRKSLGSDERLELFREVCAAVQYAHQHLVVHRDIKPGNILVTNDGTPKLLDFGIAKLLSAASEHPSLPPTVTQFRAMTLDYASPEQVRGQPITTATDIYSLGVLLYELLTGQRPYAAWSQTREELERAICHEEPPRPSSVKLELRGDLDNILMMALRKEPERRYVAVQQFSEDIRRHLVGFPVVARRDTVGYRTSKFVGRHRFGIGAIALVWLSLVGGILATARQARIAREERARAQRRYNDLRRLANDFLFEFHDAIAKLPGSTPARELVVRRATQYLDSLAAESGQDPGILRELAAGFERLGEAQGGAGGANLGDPKAALASYSKALDIRRSLAARSNAEASDGLRLADLELRLSTLFVGTGDLPRAEETARAAVARIESLRASGDGAEELARAYHRLGYAQALRGDDTGARASLERSVSLFEAISVAHPQDSTAQASLAVALNDLAASDWRGGQREAALASSRKARAIQEALAQADPNNAQLRRNLLVTLRAEGDYLSANGQKDQAVQAHTRALRLAESNLAADPRNRWDQIAIVMICEALGRVLTSSGQREAAILQLRRAARMAEQVLRDDPANGYTRNELAAVYEGLGKALFTGAPERAEACQLLERSRKLFDGLEREGRIFDVNKAIREDAGSLLAQCSH